MHLQSKNKGLNINRKKNCLTQKIEILIEKNKQFNLENRNINRKK